MTEQQALWAKEHDWYCYHGLDIDENIIVIVKDPEGTCLGRKGFKVFTDYQKLRHWAGY